MPNRVWFEREHRITNDANKQHDIHLRPHKSYKRTELGSFQSSSAVVNVDAAVAGEPTAVKQQHNRSLTFIFLLIPSMKMIKGKRHATNILL